MILIIFGKAENFKSKSSRGQYEEMTYKGDVFVLVL